mgnify:FL=1|tara:strand:+ start:35 stop:460 length:426 start_codon:yes stop_codon:yes gene_type:complete
MTSNESTCVRNLVKSWKQSGGNIYKLPSLLPLRNVCSPNRIIVIGCSLIERSIHFINFIQLYDFPKKINKTPNFGYPNNCISFRIKKKSFNFLEDLSTVVNNIYYLELPLEYYDRLIELSELCNLDINKFKDNIYKINIKN